MDKVIIYIYIIILYYIKVRLSKQWKNVKQFVFFFTIYKMPFGVEVATFSSFRNVFHMRWSLKCGSGTGSERPHTVLGGSFLL